MDVQSIQTLVGSFGFPIFMCLAMGWYIVKVHKELVDSIYQLNRTLAKLQTKLGDDDNEG
jgi:hypothetical protein